MSQGITTSRDLSVLVRCGPIVCAIPTRWVARLVLVDEAVVTKDGIIEMGGARHPYWDLADLLGVQQARSAWALVRAPRRSSMGGQDELVLALGTGTCVGVQPVPDSVALPPEVFVKRPKAIAGVFVPEATLGATYGLELDIAHLLTGEELDAAALRLKVV